MVIPKSQRELAVAILTALHCNEDTLADTLGGLNSATTHRQVAAKAKSLKVAARLMPHAADEAVRNLIGSEVRVIHFPDGSRMSIFEENGEWHIATPRRWGHLASYRIMHRLRWQVYRVPGRIILAEILRRSSATRNA